nr:hypothetical protein [Sphingobium sp. LB126]
MLRDLNRSGKRDLPADAPMPFRKEWQKIVMGDDGKINRRLWEIATIAHLRNKLRPGCLGGTIDGIPPVRQLPAKRTEGEADRVGSWSATHSRRMARTAGPRTGLAAEEIPGA